MTIRRQIFAHLLILGVLIGSFYDVITQQEHWPFSDYPMFSTVHRRHVLEWPRLFGVTPEGSEVALLKYDYLWPLDQSRLPLGLRRIYRSEGNSPRLREALADTLARYEERRLAGEHDGPALHGLRLYLVAWDIQPYAANLNTPSSRQLIGEAGLHQTASSEDRAR